MRREAQEIVPGLFLGPLQASTRLNYLKENGITHIICLRDGMEARLIFPRFPTEFQYLTIDISDKDSQNIISIFPRCRQFIDEAITIGGAVLVHCNSGIATSPAIVMGYLMYKFDWEYTTALAFVQSKRYCVSPSNFEQQLREYAPIAAAQKALRHSVRRSSTTEHGKLEHKRGWDGEGESRAGVRRRFSTDDDMDTDN